MSTKSRKTGTRPIGHISIVILCLLYQHLGQARAQDRTLQPDEQSSWSAPEATTPPASAQTPTQNAPAPATVAPAAEPSSREPSLGPSAAVAPEEPEAPPKAPAEPTSPERLNPTKEPPKAPAACEEWGQDRVLGGHVFPAAVFVPMALSTSYVGVRAGFEYHATPNYTEFYTQLPTIAGIQQQRTVDLQTINVTETADFSVRLHDYIAIFGDGYARGRVGVNLPTLLGTGADYTFGGDLGALLKIIRIASIQLALRGQVGYYQGQKAGIQGLFRDLNGIAIDAVTRLVNNPNGLDLSTAKAQLNTSFSTATAALLTPFHGITYEVSVNIAIGLGRLMGLQGSLGYASATTTEETKIFDPILDRSVERERIAHFTRPSLAAALDLDAGALGLPIGVLTEYRATPVTENVEEDEETISESSFESRVALGIYYSGRANLQLGLTGYTLLGQAPELGFSGEPSGKPLDLGAQLVFRYFW
jgi:hypothetical protein